jgi:YD repeat-containing protein
LQDYPTLAQTAATYTYTDNGLPATVKDAKGNLTSYQYDGHDRQVQTRFPSPTTANTSSRSDFEQYGYDAAGNLTSLRKRNGHTVALAYDNLNRLLTRTYPAPYTGDNASFGYDLHGRRTAASTGGSATAYVYDNAGRLTATTAGGKTLAFHYDAAGNRTRMD